ncbi:MAG: hypothetical protein ACI9F9_001679 [Candidatus Paceibacteria bacterium]|jgi:hypothetical protein
MGQRSLRACGEVGARFTLRLALQPGVVFRLNSRGLVHVGPFSMLHLSLLLLLSIQSSTESSGAEVPRPTAENYAAWKHHVLPTEEEVRHETIPWISQFGSGILAANEARKPLLFWAMNGHPLGCT